MTADRTNDARTAIRNLPTGVLGLDSVLGGGMPEYSFNLIAGAPGAGKTTLAQQIVFANATAERPALYFTVLGEPTIKMLRYQRQFHFFKPELIESAVRFVNLSEEAVRGDLNDALARIIREVEKVEPQMIVVDSFRTLGQQYRAEPSDSDVDAKMGLEYFVQRLALHLTTWEITSFLVAAFDEREQENPVLTVADGILWLSQATDRNSVVRKLQVTKVRGRAFMPGLHTFRITDRGLQVFPRIPEQQAKRIPPPSVRLPTGVPGLDAMMGGGIPAGDAMMLAGPAGTGKTTFATQFAAAGLDRGEAGVIVVFEEYPEEYLTRVGKRDADLAASVKAGRLKVLYLRPLDLSVDETLWEILEGVRAVDATWVVIDSLSGFEIALAPTFREDFRESLYRLVGALTATGVTVVMTAEVLQGQADVRFTSEKVSFITDDIVAQRYVEIDGALRTVVAVVKMRGSQHSREFRFYEITP
ncbi:MAG TPA: ATPase domain-containing protein, partial [Gemmatimonadaceae bacterium]|nr:ATPase domain-containing protein [Gemmatimonadaceae bacterium]